MFQKVKTRLILIGSSIAGTIVLLLYLFRVKKTQPTYFPEQEKKALEKEADKLETKIEKIQDKTYSDKAIEDKFNDK